MARFHGNVGFVTTVKVSPGVYEEQAIEKPYYGDLLENTLKMNSESDRVLDNVRIQNHISIVADAYATEHFHSIRYVNWAGVNWSVSSVQVGRPRLLLRLGGVYNGPTP